MGRNINNEQTEIFQEISEMQIRLQDMHKQLCVRYMELITDVEILCDNLYWLWRQSEDTMRGREGNGCKQERRSRWEHGTNCWTNPLLTG